MEHPSGILNRIINRLDMYLAEEREAKHTHTALGLFLAISEVKKELNNLEEKK